MSWETLLCITLGIVCITLCIDYWKPYRYLEGFTTGIGIGDNPFVTGYFPRRGDISFDTDESGYTQDSRNVMGYADVQGLGVNHDFCRMIIPKGTKGTKSQFFACALAGTENLSSTSYRTLTIGQGFKTSRDDYMNDADGDGKTDYCAIIKMPSGQWEPQCYRALTSSFDTRSFFDTNPPTDIGEILYFYEGIMFWFRFLDDMKDYGENLTLYAGGGITIDETPHTLSCQRPINTTTALDDRVQITEGIHFDGYTQFLRLGDSPDMSFGNKITLTTMRAICFWVYFDTFTNNAHIIDFGNGAGQDNIFIGIIGKGDEATTSTPDDTCVNPCMDQNESTIPDYPSGAQPVPTMTPQELLTAKPDEVLPRNLPPLKPLQGVSKRCSKDGQKTATLLYEIWNGKLRLQHMKVHKAIPSKTWTHVCITTARRSSGDSVRPAVQIWINGKKKAENPNGYLPQSSVTTNNYIGKSNWINPSSNYENKPELFMGSLFDLRGYNQGISPDKLRRTIAWGKKRLDI